MIRRKKILVVLTAVFCFLLLSAGVYFVWTQVTNPRGCDTLGDITPPMGYERVAAPAGSFAAYTRTLPLKPFGTKVKYYGGKENSRLQFLAAAVVDMPLLSNDEQCADAAMRLRAEHLWQTGRYGQIRFRDVNGRLMAYGGGKSRKAFENYMRRVFGSCSTFSMYHSDTRPQNPADVRPGDVFVFPTANGRLGHAVLIADVATDSKGRKALLIVEGNTPARDIHVLRNPWFPDNPWFVIDPAHPGSSMIERLFAAAGGGLRTYR